MCVREKGKVRVYVRKGGCVCVCVCEIERGRKRVSV